MDDPVLAGSARVIEPKPDQIPQVYDRGRRCTVDGCTTLLSIYNPGPDCHAHELPDLIGLLAA